MNAATIDAVAKRLETVLAQARATLEKIEACRRSCQAELTQLYESQSAYMQRHQFTSWRDTPFAKRIAELELELGL